MKKKNWGSTLLLGFFSVLLFFGAGAVVSAVWLKREAAREIVQVEVDQTHLVASQIDQLLVGHQVELQRLGNRVLSGWKKSQESGVAFTPEEPLPFEGDASIQGIVVFKAGETPTLIGVSWQSSRLPIAEDLQAQLFKPILASFPAFSFDGAWRVQRWIPMNITLETGFYALGLVSEEPYLKILGAAAPSGKLTLVDQLGRVLGDASSGNYLAAMTEAKQKGDRSGELRLGGKGSEVERFSYSNVRPGVLLLLWRRGQEPLGYQFELKVAQLALGGLALWCVILFGLNWRAGRKDRSTQAGDPTRSGEASAGAIWMGCFDLKSQDPEVLQAAYQTLLKIASETGGRLGFFGGVLGTEFLVFWNKSIHSQGEAAQAAEAALRFRMAWAQWNRENRGSPEKSIVEFHSAIEWGSLFRKNPDSAWWEGQGLALARKLVRQSILAGVDTLVSRASFEQIKDKFALEEMDSENDPAEFLLIGRKDEQGRVTPVLGIQSDLERNQEPPRLDAPGESVDRGTGASRQRRWMVHNGTQVMGPLTSIEISHLLLGQEIDFDCPCWLEGEEAEGSQGPSLTLVSAGVFTQYDGAPAEMVASDRVTSTDGLIWVYDGQEVRGPFVDPAKVETTIQQGWLGDQPLVCIGSTVNGWISRVTTQAA